MVQEIDGMLICMVQRAAVLISGLSGLNSVGINLSMPGNALRKIWGRMILVYSKICEEILARGRVKSDMTKRNDSEPLDGISHGWTI
jgi:hypothetical protein